MFRKRKISASFIHFKKSCEEIHYVVKIRNKDFLKFCRAKRPSESMGKYSVYSFMFFLTHETDISIARDQRETTKFFYGMTTVFWFQNCILENHINGRRLLMLEDPSKLAELNIKDFGHIQVIYKRRNWLTDWHIKLLVLYYRDSNTHRKPRGAMREDFSKLPKRFKRGFKVCTEKYSFDAALTEPI